MRISLISIFIIFYYIPLYGVEMHYVNTVRNKITYIDKTYAGKVIKIEDENPKSLDIIGVDYCVGAPSRSVLTNPYSWEEYYTIKKTIFLSPQQEFKQAKNVGTVVLCKHIEQGIVCLILRDNEGRKHIFRPKNGQHLDVASMPNIFINRVQMANIRNDGSIINGYNSVMERDNLDHLGVNVSYQKSDNRGNNEFIFNVVNQKGNIVTSAKTHEKSDKTVASNSNNKHNVTLSIPLGKSERNLIEKGSKLDIYADGNKLCSVDIPVRGTVVYRPTLIVRLRPSSDEVHCEPFTPNINSYLSKIMTTKQHTFTVGPDQYRVLKWQEIEL